ncbi:hypothetical protein G9H64_11540 [Aquirufa nivalisilvae]|jgi:uncharacterized coiled-coil DUF342 family protein|uniref:Uncharacterized protein n=1 Tax=Aquirufa nivalisilvae TaxID=2516557 RepID=A0A2S2DSK7_9BACT|nr:hypothetical protein [Aquirufa nivalisilvae]AWL08383.1 hypothetical protein HME7025_00511 [Aquirufa nivalisilvae]MCZ2478855.1 hypothetical protein [Aquirufa nivalisilvae]MCZ2483589.1 hypothetical protein [Aquirufa nivalisilvae]TBH75786.1 hypothetical protein EWU22_04360 [Aquirufa nivalisilvae]
MKQDIKMQYLSLRLKISQMVTRLQENEGTIRELSQQLQWAQERLDLKIEELNRSQRRLKELEKNFKKSDKIVKIVVNTDNTAVPTAELKEKLDEYIVKIDQCIEQLRQP